jgi:hypothetical protein
LSKTRG